MKSIIVTRAHPERMHTMRWAFEPGSPFVGDTTIITHTDEMAARVRASIPKGAAKVIATGLTDLLGQRNYPFEKNLIKVGEWYIGMDDNIIEFQSVAHKFYNKANLPITGPAPKGYDSWREVYRKPMTAGQVCDAFYDLCAECDANNTFYGGFASNENPYFRGRKYGYRRFVKSKAFVMQRISKDFRWGGGNFAHDSEMSVRAVAERGRVVVNNFIHPKHKMYEAGGLGSIEARRGILNETLDDIIAQYSGLVIHAKGENSALRFVRTSDASIANWQAEHLQRKEHGLW